MGGSAQVVTHRRGWRAFRADSFTPALAATVAVTG